MFELYLKLHELGHPDYLKENDVDSIKCSSKKTAIEELVKKVQLIVNKWNGEVSRLQDQYSWLLYFSVPKMLLLYELIQSPQKQINAIVNEISFLHVGRGNLVKDVQVSYETLIINEYDITSIVLFREHLMKLLLLRTSHQCLK